MPFFVPLVENTFNLSDVDVESYMLDTDVRFAYRLLRHVVPQARGVNVYKLSSGVYVENQPGDMSTVVATYYGGHRYEIDEAEAALLTAAGYGDNIEAS